MGIEICTVGGFDEVGRNCTAINIDGVVILCDLGIHLDEYIRYTQDEDIVNLSPNSLMRVNAVPDIREIKDWIPNVRAIVPTHGHIDHIGAIPFLAERFENAEIIGTPYTTSIIKAILKDEEMEIPNEINTVEPNGTYKM